MSEKKVPHIFRPMTTMRGTPIEDGLPVQQDKLVDWDYSPGPDDDVIEEVMLQRKAFTCALGFNYYKQGYGYVMFGPYGKQTVVGHSFDGPNIKYDWGSDAPWEDFDEAELRRGHGIFTEDEKLLENLEVDHEYVADLTH